MNLNRLTLLCIAWLSVLIIGLGVAAPAFVSAKNDLAVLGGLGIAAASVYGLVKITQLIFIEIQKSNGGN
ncbi:hypothetical protein [Epibacterium ulvae]|uniref:hypothetical protein n=1 Tax=Epibacterium ulvae TaxID=1156985 RepID=UPI002491D39E|nr:hypothetical protein [Epibacterium ulvae]